MNFELTEDQGAILGGLDGLVASFAIAAPKDPSFTAFSVQLDTALASDGFLGIAREDGFGPLEAALMVERLARLPLSVEAGASMLVGPALDLDPATRPIALVAGDGTSPARFLPMARVLLVDRGDHVLAVTVDTAKVEPVETLFAYPYGRLRSLDGLETRRIDDVATLRRRWRIAIAAEAAGLMQGALDLVVDHVTTRQAFGRPLGSFQALQHRLAIASESAQSTKYLALRAAWSDTELDAAIAAGFAQDRISQLTYDLHQFSGAMGLTLEFPLHLWTYRLRALLGELGGSGGQAATAAEAAWPCVA
jgi:alkylation response protein AidB-like acyl-CoA dehydrogenase